VANNNRFSGRAWLLPVLVAAALVVAGCSGGNSPHPVQGTVFLDGQPATELAGGTVMFNSSELGRSASGEIQADGTFRLGSLKKDDGALPGKYQVTVSPPETPPAGERGRRGGGSKGIAFEEPKIEVVIEAKSNDVPIQLRRRKGPG
jgi:hypothetical protein